jgi:hypothetical protein
MNRSLLAVLALGSLLSGCGSTHLYPNDVPPSSLRLVQVVDVASSAALAQDKIFLAELERTGIPRSDIHDGHIIIGRVYCCGGSAEYPTRQYAFVPASLVIEPLDIVEVRAGIPPSSGNRATANRVTRIVQKHDAPTRQCAWVPTDPGLWMRVLYCEWMVEQGWIEQTGWNHTWLKPTATPDE